MDKLDDFSTEETHPDDWLDQQYELAFLRQEAANFDQVLAETSPTATTMLLMLLKTVARLVRTYFPAGKATQKKTKKLHAMSNAIDGDDWRFFRVLAGKAAAPKPPPYGKRWMKQIFAGQMGLTLLLVAYGLAVGVPLDLSTSNWDATTKDGLWRPNRDFQVLGGIGRFNVPRGGPAALTLLQLQEHGRRILKLVNDTICKRAKANRHVVFVEQPSGSSWLEEP